MPIRSCSENLTNPCPERMPCAPSWPQRATRALPAPPKDWGLLLKQSAVSRATSSRTWNANHRNPAVRPHRPRCQAHAGARCLPSRSRTVPGGRYAGRARRQVRRFRPTLFGVLTERGRCKPPARYIALPHERATNATFMRRARKLRSLRNKSSASTSSQTGPQMRHTPERRSGSPVPRS